MAPEQLDTAGYKKYQEKPKKKTQKNKKNWDVMKLEWKASEETKSSLNGEKMLESPRHVIQETSGGGKASRVQLWEINQLNQVSKIFY